MLNKKGFTLIELLAVIVIIALLAAIVIPVGQNVYKDSQEKSEDLFIKSLNSIIEDYYALYGNQLNFSTNEVGSISKGLRRSDGTVNYVEKLVYKADGISFEDSIIQKNLISENKLVNPNGNKSCSINTIINFYKDEDGKFYYNYDLSGSNGCAPDFGKVNNIVGYSTNVTTYPTCSDPLEDGPVCIYQVL